MSWLWVCDRCLLFGGGEGECSCILGLSTLYVSINLVSHAGGVLFHEGKDIWLVS